jgi:hypothetical protein
MEDFKTIGHEVMSPISSSGATQFEKVQLVALNVLGAVKACPRHDVFKRQMSEGWHEEQPIDMI